MQHSYHMNLRISLRFFSFISYPSSKLWEEKIGLTFILTCKVGTWIILLSCNTASDFEGQILKEHF